MRGRAVRLRWRRRPGQPSPLPQRSGQPAREAPVSCEIVDIVIRQHAASACPPDRMAQPASPSSQLPREDAVLGEALIELFRTKRAKVGVIGLGYVGLPLAVQFAEAGFVVTPVDVDASKVESIRRAESYIPDIPSGRLTPLVQSGRLRASTSFEVLAEADAISICVPTPLRKTKDPDLSYVVAAVEQVVGCLRAGQLIVLESTTYPGTTEEVVRPMLERSGLVAGRDFFLA